MRRVLIFGVLTVFAACAQAAIYKCVGASGKTSYMESPCPSGAESREFSRKARSAPPPARAPTGAADEAGKPSEPKVAVRSGVQLPPVPAKSKFIQDYANLIDSSKALDAIGALQRVASEKHGTPIVVVTIDSMARLGGEGYSIERFARAWFDHWKIGRRGIVLLVSRDDRKASIELGADWGHRFDAQAQRIMNDNILPKFKKGDYSGGLVDGVKAIASLAAVGPAGKPPEPKVAVRSVLQLPPVPAEGKFIQDYSKLIDSSKALDAIGALQRVAFEQHGTPIVVVTIESMARLGGGGYTIERFARAWFDHWKIGGPGILLLVSRDDRKARIELGADWGNRFDARAQRIVKEDILPKIANGEYPGGLAEGVRALASLAAVGPAGHGSFIDRAAFWVPEFVHGLEEKAPTPLPGYAVVTLVCIGLLMAIGSFFVEPPGRYRMLLNGILMSAAALMLWVVIVLMIVAVIYWLMTLIIPQPPADEYDAYRGLDDIDI